MRVVIDAHTVASRLLAPSGPAAALFSAWELGALDFAVSEDVLAQYERLLADPQVSRCAGLDREEVASVVDGFRRLGVLVEPRGATAHSGEADQAWSPIARPYVDCALASGSELLFAGDPRVRACDDRDGIRVLAPDAFTALVAIA